jgi:hypothetical protein
MKERDIMKRWVLGWLKKNPDDYWLRIEDHPYGSIRPADGVLFCSGSPSRAIMVEFKVDRRKTLRFRFGEMPAHQMRELKRFGNGNERRWAILVYHEPAKQWYVFSDDRIVRFAVWSGSGITEIAPIDRKEERP